jgi:hypothetical protein
MVRLIVNIGQADTKIVNYKVNYILIFFWFFINLFIDV